MHLWCAGGVGCGDTANGRKNYYEYDHIDELPADLLVTRMGIFSQYIDDYDVYAHYYDPYIYADWIVEFHFSAIVCVKPAMELKPLY